MSGQAKSVTVTATAVEIACPHCDATIEAPSGSLFWTVHELRASTGARRCGVCMLPMRIAAPRRAVLLP